MPSSRIPSTPAKAPAAGNAKDKEPQDEGSAPKRPLPVLGLVLAGAGVVSVGIGTYFGFHAISQRHESDEHCGPSGCTQTGYDLNQQAKTSAWVSNFGIGLGAVAIGVGGYLLLKKPKTAPAEGAGVSLHVVPELTATSAGVGMGGAW